MRARRLVPSPALAVASLALVVAAAQPVSAAVSALAPGSVGTRQLKTGAVRTSKLHDGAVTAAKIAPGAVTSADISDGSVGLADLAATAQPRPPKAYSALNGNVVHPPADGSFTTVAQVSLPAGTWVLEGKAQATTSSNGSYGDSINCHLMNGGTSLDFAISYSQATNGGIGQYYAGSLALDAEVSLGATTTVRLDCSQGSGDSLDAYLQNGRLLAIQVTP